jgi:GNAT superfamily N-acetyltransferase
MEFKKETIKDCYCIKITAQEQGSIVGRLFLYILKNDLHKEPFGYLEDLFVEESFRKQGLGSQLVQKAIEEAGEQGCYKLIGTSRLENEKVHGFYELLGLKKYGFEFRINFK